MGAGAEPLSLHQAEIVADWVDYNGHLSEAYHVLIFGHASDAVLDRIGMDQAYRARTGRSLYTVDARLRYLAEVHLGTVVTIRTWFVAADAKRLMLIHRMYRPDQDTPVAEAELVLVSVAKPGPRSAAFEPQVAERIAGILADHAGSVPQLPPRWQPPAKA